MRRVCCSCW